MPQTVCRMFATRAVADAAAADLRLHGYRDVDVFGGAAGADGKADAYVDALCKVYVLKSEARVLASGLASGRGVVVLYTQFGTTAFALTLLDRFGPVESGLVEARTPGPRYEDAAPLSSTLQLPVLTRMKYVFQEFSGLPTLTKGAWTFSEAMQFGLTTRCDTPLSSALRLPVLTGPNRTFTGIFGPLTVEGRSHKPRAAVD